jgi:hypothetical protein
MHDAGSHSGRVTGAALLAALGLACANGSEHDAPGPGLVPIAAQEENVTLSTAQPAVVLPVTADVEVADVLSFTVANVRNDGNRAIRISASLALASDTARTAVLGSVALFPVNQGGTFALRVPSEAREMLGDAAPSDVRLVLTLTAEPTPPPGGDVPGVSIREIGWSRQGR